MPTALDYIHDSAFLAGEYDAGTSTSIGTTTTLVYDKLVNANLDATELADFALLLESGATSGEVGHVRRAGLAKATGTITVADAFTTLVASGVSFSLYGLLPPYREGKKPGWLEFTNNSLARMWVEDTLSISGVTDRIHYTIDLAVYPSLTDDTRIIEIQRPVTDADDVPTVMSRNEWSWVSDGETRRLRFPGAPFKTGETFTIKVNRPGNSRLKKNAALRAVLTGTGVTSVVVVHGGYYTALPTIAPSSGAATFTAVMTATPGPITSVTVGAGGTYTAGEPPALTVTRNASDTGWADQTSQTAGLATMSDEAIPDVRHVRVLNLAQAYRALATFPLPGHDVSEWLTKAAQWETAVRRMKQSRLPRDANDGVIRLRTVSMGGRR